MRPITTTRIKSLFDGSYMLYRINNYFFQKTFNPKHPQIWRSACLEHAFCGESEIFWNQTDNTPIQVSWFWWIPMSRVTPEQLILVTQNRNLNKEWSVLKRFISFFLLGSISRKHTENAMIQTPAEYVTLSGIILIQMASRWSLATTKQTGEITRKNGIITHKLSLRN